MGLRRTVILVGILNSQFLIPNFAFASDHYGQVTFNSLPVPGATITAQQADKQAVTNSDQDGVYHLADLADGVWTFRVEMLGFATLTEDVTISADAPPHTWALTLLSFEEITRAIPVQTAAPEPADPAAAGQPPRATARAAPRPATPAQGFQRAGVTPAGGAPVANDPTAPDDRGLGASDGFLVDGSVNNGAASPFAQMAAFGNNRRNVRSLYNGGLALQLGNSAWDARPFSFSGLDAPKPSYTDVQVGATLAGPLRIPKLVKRGPTLFLGYQHNSDHNVTTQTGIVPTLRERAGDFSQTVDAAGRPVRIVDPTSGLPFPDARIPAGQISPQAASLLQLYPIANLGPNGRTNYQVPVETATQQDNVQARFTQPFFARNQFFGSFAYQRTATDAANLFNFVDRTQSSGLDTSLNFSHRFSQLMSMRLRYQFTRIADDVTPFFSNSENVSGQAGITGNSQDPNDWGPPMLTFASGVAGLSTAQYLTDRTLTHSGGGEILMGRGRHNFTIGGDIRLQHLDVVGQQNARGTFGFTGARSGYDFADFLLGLPQTSAIAYGNADKLLRAPQADAYVTDDWRASASFTANIGVRWEFEAPFTESLGRLVNLDIAPGFMAAAPVLASDPTGAITGASYPAALIRPDWRGIQPRLGIAWRPVAGSSLVIRAGYGIYRNTSVYPAMTLLLAQQAPLSKTQSVENSAATPLTLANGFAVSASAPQNTFAVDPNLRVGYAQTWQALLQRDLPGSLTITATYLGAKGSHLLQEFVPNSYPAGAPAPCPSCPSGFVYLTSGGTSIRHSGQLQLRRRLRNGLTSTMKYTLATATDDAGAFTGVTLSGAAIAQDWRDLDAERGPSSFDQRHNLSADVTYTTGVGVGGGALLEGMKGTLLKGWTLTGQLATGSGLPLNPISLAPVNGTGIVGVLRPDVVGDPAAAAPGFYVNPTAFASPVAGHFGSAGRNSVRGPAQFSFNASVTRTFLLGNRLNLDWRVDATNVLNRVTYASINTIFGSPQFGLPNVANPMRKIQTSMRLRF